MADTKHTTTPWEAHCFMIKAGRDVITQCGYSSSLGAERSHEAEANAAFIVKAVNAHDDMLAALKYLMRQDDDAREAHGKPGANLNGVGLVDLFDCVGHPFGSGEHKQQPYRSNNLEAALADARAAIAKAEQVAS